MSECKHDWRLVSESADRRWREPDKRPWWRPAPRPHPYFDVEIHGYARRWYCARCRKFDETYESVRG